jgi:multicomponent Na+:H+ antiporter subunit B
METLILFALLSFLGMTALAILHLRDGVTAVMLSGLYSLLSAGVFVLMDAVDVAFTEAAVGAGISTVLLLATLHRTSRMTHKPTHTPLIPLVVVLVTGAALVYGTLDMPAYGDPQAAIHQRVGPDYLRDAPHTTGVPNVVTAVLASYRGYDTLGEATVVLTAAVGVLALLRRGRRQDKGRS